MGNHRKIFLIFLYILFATSLFMGLSENCYAKENERKEHINYKDSILHDNTVYTDHEVRNLVSYLAGIKKTVPPDSMNRYVTEGMLNFSWYLMHKGEWFLCGDLLKAAQQYCPKENHTLYHQVQTAVGGIELFNGNYKDAGKRFLSAYKYFNQSRDTVELLKNCVNLGLYYSKMNNQRKALEFYGKVLDIAGKDKEYETYYSIVSGYAEKMEEDSVINLSTFEKALRISIDNGYTFLLASNYIELARYYYRMENYREAINNARKALKYAEKFSQPDKEMAACGILADIYYIQKNYVAAYNMLARKSTLKDKALEERGRIYYADLNRIDSVLNWVADNVPLPGQQDLAYTGFSASRKKGMWIGIIISISIAGGILYYLRRKRHKKVTETVIIEEESEPKTISNNDNSDKTESIKEDLIRQASSINMIAESYNPMLDRIRNMIKEIPKTGDTSIDSQLRNLMNYLLQSRLPEDRENDLGKAVRKEEKQFIERLSAAYPGLTKNDLRMALYIRSGLNLREISSVSGLQSKSVNQARYRLRKSLGLGQEDSLELFIKVF